MKFIVMSATLPKIGDLINQKEISNKFIYLIDNKSKYFQNPNFCNRVYFDFSLLENNIPNRDNKSSYLSKLKDFLFEKSEEYAEKNTLHPNSVYTIIEFIFKQTASEFYSLVQENNGFFDEIFLLSGTVLEPRRKEIIERLKSSELRNKKVLLISTQVVEAGVDIDMDLGFKDKSIIDSEEQLAGRINRNVNKFQCTLYLFNCDTEKTLYGKDDRYKFAQEMDFSDYKDILSSKLFDKLYSLIINNINEVNQAIFIENIHDLEKAIATLNYQEINNQLEIIKSLNDTVYVPLEIPFKYFQKDIKVIKEFNIPFNEYINGADVWLAFENIIQNKENDFVKNRVLRKKIQGLISNYTFSIFKGGNDYSLLRTYGEEKYGFLYLENYDEVYSFEDGINTKVLMNSTFI